MKTFGLYIQFLKKEFQQNLGPWLAIIGGFLFMGETITYEGDSLNKNVLDGIFTLNIVFIWIFVHHSLDSEFKDKSLSTIFTRPLSRPKWVILKIFTGLFLVITGIFISDIPLRWILQHLPFEWFGTHQFAVASLLAIKWQIASAIGCYTMFFFVSLWQPWSRGKFRFLLGLLAFWITLSDLTPWIARIWHTSSVLPVYPYTWKIVLLTNLFLLTGALIASAGVIQKLQVKE